MRWDWRIWLTATTAAGSGSSHRWQVMSGRSTNPMIPTMAYPKTRATEMMVIGVWFRSGDMDDGITSGCFLVDLLYSSLLWISAWYKWYQHWFYHLPMEGEFPRAADAPIGCPLRYWSVGGLIDSYEYIRGMFVWLFPSFPFLVWVAAAQGVCSYRGGWCNGGWIGLPEVARDVSRAG